MVDAGPPSTPARVTSTIMVVGDSSHNVGRSSKVNRVREAGSFDVHRRHEASFEPSHCARDDFRRRAPVGRFEPNAFGLGRSHATPDTGLNNTGFRLVRDITSS